MLAGVAWIAGASPQAAVTAFLVAILSNVKTIPTVILGELVSVANVFRPFAGMACGKAVKNVMGITRLRLRDNTAAIIAGGSLSPVEIT